MLPNLYALRFILAIFVIIYHLPRISNSLGYPYYNSLPLFEKGSQAVYYFFSLSGFLIIRLIYLETIKEHKFDFKAFYLRRIQRLFPVYYLVLIIGFALYHVVLPQMNIIKAIDYETSEFFLSYIFFIPNVFKYYYDVGSILLVLWSIGVEEQFYVLMPVLLFIGRKKMITSLMIIFFFLLFLLFQFEIFYKYDNYYFYFVFGGLCAVISENYKFKIGKNIVVHLLIYTAFLISFFSDYLTFDNIIFNHLTNMLISGIFLTLITYYSIFKIENKSLNYFGKISYGIYMYHMIIITGLFFILNQLNIKNNVNPISFIVSINISVIATTILVSHLSYQYFEKRFYKPKF
jgi:peptidoglycan/LPS O-acetylase OafA/YrhL